MRDYPGMKPHLGALIFLHINKTAGTSLRKTLADNYPADERAFIYPGAVGFWSPEQFDRLTAREKARCRLIMGHIRFGLHESMPVPCRYITVLRDPVDRVLSTYYHHKTNPGTQLHDAINLGGWTVSDYLDRGFPEIDNWMVRFVSGTGKRQWSLTREDLERALVNLRTCFDYVLLQNRFVEGVAMMADYYGWCSSECYSLNASRGRKPKDEHEEGVLRRIRGLNGYDQALYEYVLCHYEQLNHRV